MKIDQFTWDVVDSNSYLIVENNEGILIDAIESSELLEEITKLKKLTIILTHSHFDHIVGLNCIRASFSNVRVLSTKACSENIGNIYKNMSSSADAFLSFYNGGQTSIKPFICSPSDICFENSFSFSWHNHQIELYALYGHSNDSLIVNIDNCFLFSGDSLMAIPTVTRFPGGNKNRFILEDLPLLKSIDKKVIVFPGHGNQGNIDEMLKTNTEEYIY